MLCSRWETISRNSHLGVFPVGIFLIPTKFPAEVSWETQLFLYFLMVHFGRAALRQPYFGSAIYSVKNGQDNAFAIECDDPIELRQNDCQS